MSRIQASEFEAKSQKFLHWFKSLPGATFHDHLDIRDLRFQEAGRGIIAVSDIPEDTTLFTIPRTAIINTVTSQLSSLAPSVFAESQQLGEEDGSESDGEPGAQVPDQWLSLILVMIYEYLNSTASPWKPYLDVLPDSFETPMFWSSDELSQLQASSIVDKIGKEQADEMFRSKIVPVVTKYESVFYPDGNPKLTDDSLIALAHRMGSTIMAYAFDLENEEDMAVSDEDDGWVEDKEAQVMMGMVPMADILNADAEFNAHVNHGENDLTVTSLRPIKAGEEVLNYYGPHPNSDLLRRYGYVTPKHSRYDVVELPWESTLSAVKETLAIDDNTWGKAISRIDPEETEDTFVLERETGTTDSNGLLTNPAPPPEIPSDMEEQLQLILKAISKANPGLQLDKVKRKAVGQTVASRVFEAKLAQYPTTLEEDRALLSDPRIGRRQKMALFVRIGEKALLREALDLIRVHHDENGISVEEGGPPRKKTRVHG
ncbi:set domain protein [Zalerion maritima]|uniref:Set domain protein n=1 Tax=Zalerion maritima TaxID=339359 RepID=A0AAD5WMQ7_9PEZI|nr:set domain protein [Zalerion maritima]